MLQLIALMAALLSGYLLKRLPLSNFCLNRIIFYIVIIILFVMGYEFGSSASNVVAQLALIGKNVTIFSGLIFLFNFLFCSWKFKRLNRELQRLHKARKQANYLHYALESGKYIVIIALGVVSGCVSKVPLTGLNELISGLLFVLLFIIGHQMRLGGVALKTIILNKTGLILSGSIIISSLLAGLAGAIIAGLPLSHGLMLTSGFGWYTLSSILTGQLLGQDYGTMAFFIDFSRELIAIILLPSLGRFFPLTMVGYCGATAMDFSLPIIKQNLDDKCTLLALSSGMLLSLVVPFLISLFAKL